MAYLISMITKYDISVWRPVVNMYTEPSSVQHSRPKYEVRMPQISAGVRPCDRCQRMTSSSARLSRTAYGSAKATEQMRQHNVMSVFTMSLGLRTILKKQNRSNQKDRS